MTLRRLIPVAITVAAIATSALLGAALLDRNRPRVAGTCRPNAVRQAEIAAYLDFRDGLDRRRDVPWQDGVSGVEFYKAEWRPGDQRWALDFWHFGPHPSQRFFAWVKCDGSTEIHPNTL